MYSLVEAEVVLQYRIKVDGGLLDACDSRMTTSRLQTLTNRERALRIALVGGQFGTQPAARWMMCFRPAAAS